MCRYKYFQVCQNLGGILVIFQPTTSVLAYVVFNEITFIRVMSSLIVLFIMRRKYVMRIQNTILMLCFGFKVNKKKTLFFIFQLHYVYLHFKICLWGSSAYSNSDFKNYTFHFVAFFKNLLTWLFSIEIFLMIFVREKLNW